MVNCNNKIYFTAFMIKSMLSHPPAIFITKVPSKTCRGGQWPTYPRRVWSQVPRGTNTIPLKTSPPPCVFERPPPICVTSSLALQRRPRSLSWPCRTLPKTCRRERKTIRGWVGPTMALTHIVLLCRGGQSSRAGGDEMLQKQVLGGVSKPPYQWGLLPYCIVS